MQQNVNSDLSLPDFVERLLNEAEPLSQNTGPGNLGFGWIYYALIRNLCPAYVIAIGSRRGFMPFCAARALQDNGGGQVIFIDPSYSGYGDPGWSGAGLWSDPVEVCARIERHGLRGWIRHLKMTSEQAFSEVRELVGKAQPMVLIIDGAHTYQNSVLDFDLYSTLITEGVVVFHDSVANGTGVPQTITELRNRGLSMITLHLDVGLTIVEITPRSRVDQCWDYLCRPSNRWSWVADAVRKELRPDDHILDSYCGWSPLAAHLHEARIFGFDSDPQIIQRLRNQYPMHTWQAIEEYRLPYADLPKEIDVLAGLGVSHGHSPWDPQQALNNIRYLLARYLPRTCLFETARDYHDAIILEDLQTCVTRLGYVCHYQEFDSDLSSYSRRRLLLANRAE
jgi:Methyltransferase domain